MKKITVTTMMITTFSGTVYAKPTQFIPDLSSDSISVATSVGMLAGESKELVYYPDSGRKLSQLDWKIKNVAILKGDVAWDAYSFLTLNARGWTSLASGSGHMDDYDWQNTNQSGWTDHSFHPATVNYANEYDLNAKGWLRQGSDYKIGLVVGYQETRFSWTTVGGSYNYNDGANVGTIPPGESGIGYSQRFSMPYIGLVGRYYINDFEFNAQFKFSDWVHAHSHDEHYLRNLQFLEDTSNSRYYGISVDAGYYITRNARVFAELTCEQYEEGKGGVRVINTGNGKTVFFDNNSGGISNKNHTITAGLQYRF